MKKQSKKERSKSKDKHYIDNVGYKIKREQ